MYCSFCLGFLDPFLCRKPAAMLEGHSCGSVESPHEEKPTWLLQLAGHGSEPPGKWVLWFQSIPEVTGLQLIPGSNHLREPEPESPNQAASAP